jgi:DNA recombination protein RmuC
MSILFIVLAICVLFSIFILIALTTSHKTRFDAAFMWQSQELKTVQATLTQALSQFTSDARELRTELNTNLTQARLEQTQNFNTLHKGILDQIAQSAAIQNKQLESVGERLHTLQLGLSDTLSQQLGQLSEHNVQRLSEVRKTLEDQQKSLLDQLAQSAAIQNKQLESFTERLHTLQLSLSDTLAQKLNHLGESNALRIGEVRKTLEDQLQQLQASNTKKLDEMRMTVDEKLQSTLQERLGTAFKQVADRLEQVHRGLGEMQTLAQGVGDLKHLLTNVKTRGTFGETQLESLLEHVLAPEQYQMQVCLGAARTIVDAAVKLPGKGDEETVVWLPIDAKFPIEDYERVIEAQACADAVALELASKALESRVRQEAKSISEKYISPPNTTDFAILFLPSEGLYAEVLRRRGLMEVVQRDHHIILAGPSNLLAILNSLRMGFKTLAIERRSSDVWKVLGSVKTEFQKFGDVLGKIKSQTQTMLNTIDSAETRSRAMQRALKSVESLPEHEADTILKIE